MTLLDLSAAFDTLDHSILLHVCMTYFAYLARLLNVFYRMCLIDSSLSASTVGSLHKRSFITGSVLGPILFTLYTQPLSDIISQGKCHYHKFADDTSLHQSSALSDFHSLIHDIEQC